LITPNQGEAEIVSKTVKDVKQTTFAYKND